MLLLQLCTLLLTFKGLEGLNNSQNCLKLPDKIVKSPIILKVKIKSKFNGQNGVIETNVKILKILKGSRNLTGLTFLRFVLDKNQCSRRLLKLGGKYVFFVNKDFTSMASPEKATKRLKKVIKKLTCKNCSKYKDVVYSFLYKTELLHPYPYFSAFLACFRKSTFGTKKFATC